jgi:hypothetical protein
MIVKESGIKYHYTHHISHPSQVGFQTKEGAKKSACKYCITKEEKYDFKKRPQRYLWVSTSSKKKKKALP